MSENKKKLLISMAMFTLFATFLFFTAFSIQKINEDVEPVNQFFGDISASDGKYLYYSMNGIYRLELDGTNKRKIDKDNASCLVFSDGWLYYCNQSDNRKLYRIKSDGSGKTKLGDQLIINLSAYNDSIYFTGGDTNDFYARSNGAKLYQMNKSDLKITEIDDKVMNFYISDHWIYYTNHIYNDILFKIKVDGSSKTKLYNGKCTNINVIGQWIYFTGPSSICKIDVNGEKFASIYNGAIGNFKAQENWIYYVKDERLADFRAGSIYKIQNNGLNNTKIINDPNVISIDIIGDSLYYYRSIQGGEFNTTEYLKAHMDGTNKQVIESKKTPAL